MKGLVITTENTMYVKEFQKPLYKSVGEIVGGYIEVVNPRYLEIPLCFVCNEEGILKNLPLNVMGSLWYGTQYHGHPILGNIVVMKEDWTEDGYDLVGLDDGEIGKIKELVQDMCRKVGHEPYVEVQA